MADKKRKWVPLFDSLKEVGDYVEVAKLPNSSVSFSGMINTIQKSYASYCATRRINQKIIIIRLTNKIRVTRIK